MQVAVWFIEAMAVFIAGLYAQERWNIFGWLANWAWDQILAVYCAMMRHTGDPAYTYKARRYA